MTRDQMVGGRVASVKTTNSLDAVSQHGILQLRSCMVVTWRRSTMGSDEQDLSGQAAISIRASLAGIGKDNRAENKLKGSKSRSELDVDVQGCDLAMSFTTPCDTLRDAWRSFELPLIEQITGTNSYSRSENQLNRNDCGARRLSSSLKRERNLRRVASSPKPPLNHAVK